MVKKYENGGDRETRINTLEAIIETPFHDRYKGGLLQWISDYENAFALIEELECQNWNDDAARKRRILNNVSSNEGMEKYMFKQQCKDMTADQVFEHLRKFASSQTRPLRIKPSDAQSLVWLHLLLPSWIHQRLTMTAWLRKLPK